MGETGEKLTGKLEKAVLAATSWALLGMTSYEEEVSGYDLKKWIDWSVDLYYWSPSYSQIYAELKKLEVLGLVTSHVIAYLDGRGYAAMEATADAVDGWVAELSRRADASLFSKANSCYLGANVPGKPRVFMLFIGGFAAYNDICAEVADAGYKGFDLLTTS